MRRQRCPGSGMRSGAYPGSTGFCTVCEKWARVLQDSTFGVHYLTAREARSLRRVDGAWRVTDRGKGERA